MDDKLAQKVPVDKHALENLRGRTVLVTGAGGSIGSQLCMMMAKAGVEKLTMVSISESALYKLKHLLKGVGCETVFVLGDIANSRMMRPLLANTDVVVHAAAHKHVPICEENPITAIENNVTATRKLLYAAKSAGVKQFVQISTDKAVRPSSVMGATKRACELLALHQNWDQMNVSVVRFGNVLGSDGSVIPLWREQIARGGPITVTDPECTRFFMSIEDACMLIINVIYMDTAGLYVFDMGNAVNLYHLAQKMVVNSGMAIDIEFIGMRPGEKLHEELTYGGGIHPTGHPKVMRVVERQKYRGQQLIPDLEEHAARRREKEALETLWNIVQSDSSDKE